MRQMPARGEVHAKDRITGLQQRLKNPLVRLRPRIRLDVGKVTAKKLFGTINRKVLGNVNMLATAVIAPTGVTFGIFVGHDRPLGLNDRSRDDVFRCDQLDFVALPSKLTLDCVIDLRVTGL